MELNGPQNVDYKREDFLQCFVAHCFGICLQALKAKEKEEDEQKLEQYDGLFASIAQSGTLSSINIHSTMNALEALQNKTKVEKELSKFVNGDSSKKVCTSHLAFAISLYITYYLRNFLLTDLI